MRNSFDEKILDEANDWINANQKVVLATVIQTWGSSPRPTGSRMIINEKGDFSGSVSGGCVESAVVREAQELINDNKSFKKLSGIKVSGKTVTIGATTKHVEVATSKDVKKAIPALAKLAGNIGDAQVRNRGTIGGSISNNDPSACYPSACMALNAVIHTNKRKIDAEKLELNLFDKSLSI